MFMAGAILKAEKAKPAPAASAGRDAATAHKIDFKRDIAPIFEASCVACHGAEKPLGQLRLDSETALLRGGISGKVIVAGKSGESLLVRRLLGQGGAPRMPMGPDALPKAKLELIRAWIDQGLSTAEASSASLAADDSATSAVGTPTAQAESGLFVTRIRPILAARCYQCHGPEVQQNGLRVDSLAALLKGSATGKVLVPGSSEKSRLVRRRLGLDKPMMPYGGPPLAQEEIQLVRDWINQGAPGPDSAGGWRRHA
jgi:mono/diheme cytochrome c family protein